MTKNMRVRSIADGETTQDYASLLLKLGNGKEPHGDEGTRPTKLLSNLYIAGNTTERLTDWAYSDLNQIHSNNEWMPKCAITAPKNRIVRDINAIIVIKLLACSKTICTSLITMSQDINGNSRSPEDITPSILNKQAAFSSPLYRYILYLGMSIMMLHNIRPD
ncbi:hypothetical protein GGI25_005149 [Coemansia spiralis]|uniref:Uncharacterized protein n=2 Tax=Coemansia TaxID=4863 RepID=A0A9W8FZ54_9FUNG|nr:hypothetical protein EDC05_005081 [Coemansia umbellata]KAJ2620044.1 hypothetical protein GGI26_005338 [Coemansia sp. RSA 1358]KAJ2672387.1 hypothetical protein GGI25_005149 [Coemansia spiralis]